VDDFKYIEIVKKNFIVLLYYCLSGFLFFKIK